MKEKIERVLGFLFWIIIVGAIFLMIAILFTSNVQAQGQLGQVVQRNLDFIELNHLRGDINNLQARAHQIVYHNRYGYGYYDGGGFFYGTDQYGRGSRGRVRLNPLTTGAAGALIGGGIGGGKGALIGGGIGLATSIGFNAVADHRMNKKEKKQAEEMARQAEMEARSQLERKFYWNDTESVNTGIFYQDLGGTQYLRVLPGQRVQIFILQGSDIGVMAEGVVTPSGRTINKEVTYGKGKQRLPNNAGWRTFNVKLDQLDW